MHIAIEWTSVAFHAWLLRPDGAIAAEHSSARGVNSIHGKAFESALVEEIGAWLAEARAILLSGMVTSRTGWVESPFAIVPAALSDLLESAVRKDFAGLPPLYFLPGIARVEPVPDVMRGEEMAVFGIERVMPSRVVLPGAHSKWVRTDGERILDITTYMSGEVLNLLRRDSLVSRLIPEHHTPQPAAFERGVLMAQDKTALAGGVLQRIFSARSLVLFDRLRPEEISDYLTGVMLGSEIAEAVAGGELPSTVHVLGQTPIAASYRTALKWLGIDSPEVDGSAARGFGRLVQTLKP